jgi:hypothetical protein
MSGPSVTDRKHIRKYGKKVDHAEEWQIPILNHLWLEECFVRWANISPCREAFLVFPPGVNFLDFLSERSLEHGTVETWAAREDVQQERREALGLTHPEAAISDEEIPLEAVAGDADKESTDGLVALDPAESRYTSKSAVEAALVPASPKRAQLTPRLVTPHEPRTPSRALSIVNPRTPGSSRQRNGTDPSNILVGSSKRKAATVASDRLHNEMGPDMIKWEKERRRFGKKREHEVVEDETVDDDPDIRPPKTNKQRAPESPSSDIDNGGRSKEMKQNVRVAVVYVDLVWYTNVLQTYS